MPAVVKSSAKSSFSGGQVNKVTTEGSTNPQRFAQDLETVLSANKPHVKPILATKPTITQSTASYSDDTDYDEDYSDVREYQNIDDIVVLSDTNYHVISDFSTTESGEISVNEGEQVIVKEKNDAGWWLVSADAGEGWVPSAYLQPVVKDKPLVAKKMTITTPPVTNGNHKKPTVITKPSLPAKPKPPPKGSLVGKSKTSAVSSRLKNEDSALSSASSNPALASSGSKNSKVSELSKMFQ